MSNEVGQTESTKELNELSTPDDTQTRIELVASRGLLLTSLILVCFIMIGLFLGVPENTTVGTLMPGSQEWLHYHFFHFPRGRGGW